jgi:hypothetical protein
MLPVPSRNIQMPAGLDVLIAADSGEAAPRRTLLGLPRFTLCLEAHASCAPGCPRRRSCPGKDAGFRPGSAVEDALAADLRILSGRHPGGFALRLHRLGDFYDLGYLERWAGWLREVPEVHVHGATGWPPDSEIGARILTLRLAFPERWWIRFVRISAPCSAAASPDLRLVPAPPSRTSGTAPFPADHDEGAGIATGLPAFDQGAQEPRGCRYILGDTAGHDWRYCQETEQARSSYCVRHHALSLKRRRPRPHTVTEEA